MRMRLPLVLAGCMRSMQVQAAIGKPLAGHTQYPIWLGTPPRAKPLRKPEGMAERAQLAAGRSVTW